MLLLQAALGTLAIATISAILFKIDDHRAAINKFGDFVGECIAVICSIGFTAWLLYLALTHVAFAVLLGAGVIAWAIFKTRR